MCGDYLALCIPKWCSKRIYPTRVIFSYRSRSRIRSGQDHRSLYVRPMIFAEHRGYHRIDHVSFSIGVRFLMDNIFEDGNTLRNYDDQRTRCYRDFHPGSTCEAHANNVLLLASRGSLWTMGSQQVLW